MKKETITQVILTADEGLYLTDGQTYGKTVVLPMAADHTVWQEITEAEAKTRMQAYNEGEGNNYV